MNTQIMYKKEKASAVSVQCQNAKRALLCLPLILMDTAEKVCAKEQNLDQIPANLLLWRILPVRGERMNVVRHPHTVLEISIKIC